ncbi:MAG: PAS domain S-box protein [Deltaproteobacteria bacterium]|nr:PAS domain S-box protein [Deltaproteobacteria bacterium]
MHREPGPPRPFLSLAERGQADQVYEKLLDAAPDAVVVVEDSGRIVLANIQTERLFDYHRDEVLGREIEILIPERFRGAHGGHRDGFFATPRVRPMGSSLELFGRRRDGSEFPIEISLSPLPTDEGMLVSASIRDITDRRRSEQEVRRVQGHLLSAVESIQGAFVIFDANDRLVLCNSEYRQLFGRHVAGQIVGKTFDELLDGALDAGLFQIAEGSAASLRERLVANHRDPRSAIDVSGPDGRSFKIIERRTGEAGTVMTIWDVTDDVAHERELRKARAVAEAANSAKSEFLSSMSHELRTPLNAILGFAQLLQRDKKTPLADRHRERIEHVLKGGEHLLRLVDEVLDLSRIEAGRVTVSPEPVRVADVLRDVVTTLDAIAARAEITLTVGPLPRDDLECIADRTRFKQILLNFGSNPIKYGRRGGRADLLTAVTGVTVRISVVDDGLGIPEEKQDRIFQPFHRAGQEAGPIEGTGIGLALSKRLAELMEGAVGFRSKPAEGSEFWIEVPLHRPVGGSSLPQRAAQPTESVLSLPLGERHLVVYIEDNPSNIAFMEDLMSDFERVELITAPTAELGIEIVRARRPRLVIMDINLPGMSGFEATDRLRQWPETRSIPIVALSAAAMVRDQARVAEAGFHRYLTKPIDVDELAGVLEELLAAPRQKS